MFLTLICRFCKEFPHRSCKICLNPFKGSMVVLFESLWWHKLLTNFSDGLLLFFFSSKYCCETSFLSHLLSLKARHRYCISSNSSDGTTLTISTFCHFKMISVIYASILIQLSPLFRKNFFSSIIWLNLRTYSFQTWVLRI